MRLLQSVTVQATVKSSGTVAKTETFGAPQTVNCQITPLDAKSGYDRIGRDISNGWWLFCATSDASKFEVGAKVIFGSVEMRVVNEPETFGAGNMTNHSSVVLEEWRA